MVKPNWICWSIWARYSVFKIKNDINIISREKLPDQTFVIQLTKISAAIKMCRSAKGCWEDDPQGFQSSLSLSGRFFASGSYTGPALSTAHIFGETAICGGIGGGFIDWNFEGYERFGCRKGDGKRLIEERWSYIITVEVWTCCGWSRIM